MSYLVHYNASHDLSGAPASAQQGTTVPAEASKTLAGVLSASVLAALLVVAEQLIDSWADGHLLLAWVLLWSAARTRASWTSCAPPLPGRAEHNACRHRLSTGKAVWPQFFSVLYQNTWALTSGRSRVRTDSL